MVLKIALVIMILFKKRNVLRRKPRKQESLVRTKKGTKGAFIREISKSTTHNFLRTTSSLQKMSSAPDKHSVKTLLFSCGEVRGKLVRNRKDIGRKIYTLPR